MSCVYGYKSMKWKDLPEIFRASVEMTGIIIFLIGVSSIMSWVMAFRTFLQWFRMDYYQFQAINMSFY